MSGSSDRLTLLATFARIADAGSISAAARDLDVTQPTVSRRLAELEARLRTTLIRRTTHEMALTETGEALLADARTLLSGWEALEERHAADADELTGRLRVVAPVALGQTLLSGVACRFQAEHPGITLDWELEDRAIRFAAVGCDCWIRIGEVPDDTLVVRRLADVERIVVAGPDYLAGVSTPRAPEDLERCDLLALAPFEGAAIPLSSPGRKPATIRPAVRLSSNNIVALREAALAGLGIAVLPRWFVRDALRAGTLADALPRWTAPTLAVNVAYASTRHQPRRLRAFVDRLAESVPDLLDD